MDIERIKDLLFDDGNGIFTRLRNGNYSISSDEKNQIIAFSDYCNTKLKEGSISTEAAIMALEIVYALPKYNDQEWTTHLAEESILRIERDIEV